MVTKGKYATLRCGFRYLPDDESLGKTLRQVVGLLLEDVRICALERSYMVKFHQNT